MTREEAMRIAQGLITDFKCESETMVEFCNVVIKALEQEPKTGHWIYDRTRDWDGECKYECSECGMGSDVDYAYCMRCGAKMQEESEEKE